MNPSLHHLYRRPHSSRRSSFREDVEAAEAYDHTASSSIPQRLPISAATATATKDHSSSSPTPSSASTSLQSTTIPVNNAAGGEGLHDNDSDEDKSNNGKKKIWGLLGRQDNDWWQTWSENWMHSHWPILLVSVLVFAVLAGAGIALYLVVAQSQEDDMQDKIMDLAVETGDVSSVSAGYLADYLVYHTRI